MSKTNGQMDMSAKLMIGTRAELEGYVVPTVSEEFTGDLIDIYVMEGDDAESLFVPGSCAVTALTEGWAVTVTGVVEAEGGFSKYELYCASGPVSGKPVLFRLSGTVNDKEGVAKICLKENTSEVEAHSRSLGVVTSGPGLTEQYLFKKKAEPYVNNFIAAKATDKLKPCTLFEPGEPICFSWESGKGHYELYRGDADHLVYEGTESSFEYSFGIYLASTFILKATFTDNKKIDGSPRCCYETLALNINCLGKPLTVKGVEDGAGSSFVFTQYDSKNVDYIWMAKDDDVNFQRGGLELLGEQLYADRLPDGRIVVLSLYGSRVYFQIQNKAGEPGFNPVKELTRDVDGIQSVLTLHTECDKNALYIAVEAYGNKAKWRCIYLAKLVTGEEVLNFWYELAGNNDQEGIRADENCAWICDSHGAERTVWVYDLTAATPQKLRYSGGEEISHTVKNLKSDGVGGLYCRSFGQTEGLGVFRFLFTDNKTYSLNIVDGKDNLYYDVGSSSQGVYCLSVRSDYNLYGLLEKSPGSYSEVYISSQIKIVGVVKYRNGLPVAACVSQDDRRFLLRYEDADWRMFEY